MSGHLAIVIPALNEQRTIAEVVGRARFEADAPVIVVDDASSDDTGDAAKAAGALVLRLPFTLGPWVAAQTGMRLALRLGAECVVTMDADGQHDPAQIRRIAAPVLSGRTDLAIGSCRSRASTLRHIAWHYLRALSGLPIGDLTSGFRAYSSAATRIAVSKRATALDYQDIGVLLLLTECGLGIEEVPIPMRERIGDKSRVFSSWWRVARYMALSSVLGGSKRPLRWSRRLKRAA